MVHKFPAGHVNQEKPDDCTRFNETVVRNADQVKSAIQEIQDAANQIRSYLDLCKLFKISAHPVQGDEALQAAVDQMLAKMADHKPASYDKAFVAQAFIAQIDAFKKNANAEILQLRESASDLMAALREKEYK